MQDHLEDYLDICRQAERHLDYLDNQPEEDDYFLNDRIDLESEEQE